MDQYLVDELVNVQRNLHDRMESFAKDNFDSLEYLGSVKDESWPVYDGVIRPSEYLRSGLRIMWILKEPRDEEKNGRYCGGGWQMFADCDDENFNSKIAFGKAYQTLFRVAQISYAVENAVSVGEAMLLGAKAVDALKYIAYVNIGKMPGPGTTPACRVKQLYRVWKPFVLEQIQMYKPELIICGGSGILDNMAADLGSIRLSKPTRMYVGHSGARKLVVDCHRWNGIPIVWTAHPTAKVSKYDYFKCTIEACNGALHGEW